MELKTAPISPICLRVDIFIDRICISDGNILDVRLWRGFSDPVDEEFDSSGENVQNIHLASSWRSCTLRNELVAFIMKERKNE